jgi:hypothetical protein
LLLVVTTRDDLTADLVVVELRRRRAPYLRFNTEDYPTAVSVRWRPDGKTTLTVGGRAYDAVDFHTVWYRRPVPPVLPERLDPDLRAWARDESQEALDGIWRTLPARWVNHPDAEALAECKPEQLRTARRLGFTVPPTLVTNDKAAADQFIATHARVVCKPLYEGLVTRAGQNHIFWTTSLTDLPKSDVGDFGPEPYLLQAEVEKEADVRVTVIGERVFAVAIRKPQGAPVDWRRMSLDELRHDVIALPDEVAALCLSLVRHYGLSFGAIDLALTNGGYEFFELNPNGEWAWLEDETGLALCTSLVDLLLNSNG